MKLVAVYPDKIDTDTRLTRVLTDMLKEILPFIEEYVEALNTQIKHESTKEALSRKQEYWLRFCLMGLIITNRISWKTLGTSIRSSLFGFRPF
jgi:hypothetical protein